MKNDKTLSTYSVSTIHFEKVEQQVHMGSEAVNVQSKKKCWLMQAEYLVDSAGWPKTLMHMHKFNGLGQQRLKLVRIKPRIVVHTYGIP